jgi:hypothetical protein
MKLSFYTPVAYDYNFSISSIKSYYDIADEIILGIDKDRISWTGRTYKIDDTFFKDIESIDVNKKIKIIEDNFHIFSEPMKNDTHERNVLSTKCNESNYIIAIDCDEVLLNTLEFKQWMDNNANTDKDIGCLWLSVYKVFGDNYLITLPHETTIIGTNLRNSYKKARLTLHKFVLSPLKILHFSWGRSRSEIEQKLLNWSHANDFNTKKYLEEVWDNVNLENYKQKRYLHPLAKEVKNWWVKLDLIKSNDVMKNF